MMALVAHKYMPEQMPIEELRATFAAREHTLEFLVKAIRDQIGARTLTSYLITGPRGSGKTTLVLMLCLRLREEPELAAAWLPVRFPEELPAITSLRDFFATALAVLAEEGIDGARAWHERVEREPDERRSRGLAVTALRRLAEERGRRLILFVENFDQLFDRAWAKEEATLRRLLMSDPFMLIVGTTVRQFEALRAYGRAFFNYFCEVPLKRLDDKQVRALLVSRAEWDGRPDVAERYRAHQADIRAICRLTGGNARLTLMLYEILSHGDIKSVVATLRQLVDQLTPLLKDVLEHELTDQQRKVVDALMRAGGTATPRTLASATRLSLNTVTTQLQRLREAEVVNVQGGGKGRPAYYFVPDQLFCTWYQMRYLHPHRRRIEMFLEVLRTWFKAEQRLERVKSVVAAASSFRGGPLVGAAVAAEYYAASLAGTEHDRAASDLAVATWLKTGNLQEAAFALAELRDVRGEDRRLYEASAYAGLGEWAEEHGDVAIAVQALRFAVERDPTNGETRLRYGVALDKQGEHGLAFECFDEVARDATDPRVKSLALVSRGIARGRQGDTSGAIADFTAVVEPEGAPREQVMRALVGRGSARGQERDLAGAIADFTAGVELEGAPREQLVRALVGRGSARAGQGDLTEAVADFTAVVELEGVPRGQMARALVLRGASRTLQADTAGAIADYTAVVELEGAPHGPVAASLVSRGIAREKQGDSAGAIADYTAVVKLEGAPHELVVRALVRRGTARAQQGNASGALADFTAVVDLEGAPREQGAQALVNRGVSRGQQGDTSGAIADYTAVVELMGAPREQVVRALVGRAAARMQQRDIAGVIADYTALVELEGAACEQVAKALVIRGTAREAQGDTPAAISDYTAVVELEDAPHESVSEALVRRGIAREQQGDTAGAIADYTAVVELDGAPREKVVRALVRRGIARAQQDDASGALADYTAVAGLEGAPREEVAKALFKRGVVRGDQGDASGASADFTAVVELEGAPLGLVGAALINRGVIRGQQGDASGALADYTAVAGLEGAPREEVAKARFNRGVVRGNQGDASGASADFTAVIELEGVPRELVGAALVNRGVARALQGDASGAIRDLTAVVDLSEVPPELQATALFSRAQAYVNFGQSDRAFEDAIAVATNPACSMSLRMWAFAAAARVSTSDQHRVERVCSDAKASISSLAPEQRRESILELLSCLSSAKTASVWLRVWRAVSQDQPPDVLSSLAFLDAVAGVLEGRDRSVLNPLPPEQREFAEEILRKLQPPTPTDTGPVNGVL